MAVFIVLAGCANAPTLQELEDEAIVSGDWSAVEEREQLMVRKRRNEAPACGKGMTFACFETGLKIECACVKGGGGSYINMR